MKDGSQEFFVETVDEMNVSFGSGCPVLIKMKESNSTSSQFIGEKSIIPQFTSIQVGVEPYYAL